MMFMDAHCPYDLNVTIFSRASRSNNFVPPRDVTRDYLIMATLGVDDYKTRAPLAHFSITLDRHASISEQTSLPSMPKDDQIHGEIGLLQKAPVGLLVTVKQTGRLRVGPDVGRELRAM